MSLVSRKRLYCPHCDEQLSRSLYYQHKQLYYDSTQHEWKKYRPTTPTVSDVNFEFSPDKDHRASGLTANITNQETEGIIK